MVAGAEEVEEVEEEGGAALREKPMFSKARGEETDQYPREEEDEGGVGEETG